MITSAASEREVHMNSPSVFKYIFPQLNNHYHRVVEQNKKNLMTSFIIVELNNSFKKGNLVKQVSIAIKY